MAYRNEVEALRARLEQVERENEALRRAHQAGRGAAAAGGRRGAIERLFGGPLVASVDRAIEGELPASTHERVLELLRDAYGALGEAQVIGGTLTWRLTSSGQRWIEVIVSAREGRTRVRITEHLGGLAALWFGGGLAGAGTGGAGALVPLVRGLESGWAMGLIPLWIASTYAGARAGYARSSRRRAAALAGLGDRVAQLVESEISHGGPQVRVAPPREDEQDERAEEARSVASRGDARTSKA